MSVAIENLSFAYLNGGDPVIDSLDWSFDTGSITVVTGTSGRGKSTLLYLLALMLTPTHGEIRIGSSVVSGLSDAERSRVRGEQVGFVFQDAVLDPARTVLDNVVEGALFNGLGRAVATRRAHALLERFGVSHRFDHRPGEISGGQAQRVALCRALVKQPSVVLADEPTGNLDPESAAVVFDALVESARGGATVVVATHDPTVALRADEILRLR